MKADTLAVRLARETLGVLREAGYEREDLCVLATRVGLHALNELRVPARPTPVRVAVYTDAYRDFMFRRADEPTPADLRRAQENGAHAVMLGFGVDPGRRPGYDGHLVLTVGNRWLVDMTIGQASRPAKGIELPDGLVTDARPMLREGHPLTCSYDGFALTYMPHENDTYLVAPDWTMPKPGNPLVQELVRRLR